MKVIPLGHGRFFVFILVCNLFTLVGLGSKYEFLIVPNVGHQPAARGTALYVIVLVHVSSARVGA